MSKKSTTFAENYEEPTALANSQYADKDYDDDPVGALAYTDFTKPVPVLEGKDAERFIRMMEENERKAAERAKRPMTVEEAKKELSYEKIFLEMKENEIKKMKDSIKKLEEYIKNN
jgi:DNA repair exonuclease SbcCD ATPase subunit